METDRPVRLAVVGTPRSGNTWVRHLLGTAYRVPHFSRHSLTEADWAGLPAEVVLQLHWRRDPRFEETLHRHGFRVVTVARHPLDVLISILHFCIYESESEYWLLGAGGSEAGIQAAMPRSRPFVEYATGPRAAALLAVTPDWWGRPDVLGIRYEDCVRDTDTELRRIEAAFGPVRAASRAAVIDACAMSELRKGAINNHFWKGSPGLWRMLLPTAETAEIAPAVAGASRVLGYAVDPDPGLSAAAADRNWVALVGDEIKATLRRTTAGHKAQIQERLDRIAELDAHITMLEAKLRESVTFGGPVARRVKGVWNRSPGLANAVRWLLGKPRPGAPGA
ncbi:MAG TPA: sulfotransferase domain-containing protein [Gemmataceae bacterium]|nr:sulfotransferase domain-containing protein [Gemmataceae bacterium]